MESKRPPGSCRRIVGESRRNLGRMGDYLSAQVSAATDFKMGKPVAYLQSRGCPVVMKYKAAENRRAKQDRLISALEAEGHLLVVLRRIRGKPDGSLGAQGRIVRSAPLHRNADLRQVGATHPCRPGYDPDCPRGITEAGIRADRTRRSEACSGRASPRGAVVSRVVWKNGGTPSGCLDSSTSALRGEMPR